MSDQELDSASCGKAAALHNAMRHSANHAVVATDNQARRQVEGQLRWSEEGLRLMVENATDCAIVMLDPQGRVVSWNRGAQRVMGYGAQEIVGQHCSRFYPGPDIERGAPQRQLGIAATIGRFEDEGFRVRKDGTVFRARVVCTAIRDQCGILHGFAKLTRDLTGRTRVEAEITSARLLAEVANHAKADFRSGRVLWSLQPVSLTEVMRECRSMIEPQARERGVCVRFPRVDTPCFVTADRMRVKQVIVNLLSNVIRYNPIGGSVVVECKASAPQRLRVSVHDTGAGRAAQELAQLFQPFSRPGHEARSEQGTGIGLVVSKRLVELMGGAIGVESTLGQGNVYWIELVVAP